MSMSRVLVMLLRMPEVISLYEYANGIQSWMRGSFCLAGVRKQVAILEPRIGLGGEVEIRIDCT